MGTTMKKIMLGVRMCGWLVIALVTMELGARTEDRLRHGAPFFGNYSLDSLYQYDGMGKWGKPNSSYLKWHMNDLGYRGPAMRNDGAYRIACMGSSETFGLYESEQKEWPRQLETILNRRDGGQSFEVVDVAFPGMSVGTAVRRLPQVLSTLAPKMVVVYASYTPYIDRPVTQALPPPALQPTSSPAPQVRERFEPRLQGKVETLLKTALPAGLQMWIREWQVQRAIRGETVMSTLPQENIAAFRADLDTLVTQLQQHGVEVVLVTHATRFGKTLSADDHEYLTGWRKFFPTLTEEGLLDMEQRMSDAVREEGRVRDVPVVDAAARLPPGPGNFVEFVHFTDAGAEGLAGLVADAVKPEAVRPQGVGEIYTTAALR